MWRRRICGRPYLCTSWTLTGTLGSSVPCKIMTQAYKIQSACSLTDPAHTHSPSPQHYFHMVLFTRFCGLWYGSSSLHLYTLSITYFTLADLGHEVDRLVVDVIPNIPPIGDPGVHPLQLGPQQPFTNLCRVSWRLITSRISSLSRWWQKSNLLPSCCPVSRNPSS